MRLLAALLLAGLSVTPHAQVPDPEPARESFETWRAGLIEEARSRGFSEPPARITASKLSTSCRASWVTPMLTP